MVPISELSGPAANVFFSEAMAPYANASDVGNPAGVCKLGLDRFHMGGPIQRKAQNSSWKQSWRRRFAFRRGDHGQRKDGEDSPRTCSSRTRALMLRYFENVNVLGQGCSRTQCACMVANRSCIAFLSGASGSNKPRNPFCTLPTRTSRSWRRPFQDKAITSWGQRSTAV